MKKFLDRIIFVKKMKKEDILARIGFWAKSGSRPSFVEDRLGEKTELDAVAEFSVHNQRDDIDGYIQRCWIHTHPRFKAFMSSVDIFQLFMNTRANPKSFGIVISPRGYDIKLLCVHITKTGLRELEEYYTQAVQTKQLMEREGKEFNVQQFVIDQIRSSDNKFYCQIPFRVVGVPCFVADLRDERDVLRQLTKLIVEGDHR